MAVRVVPAARVAGRIVSWVPSAPLVGAVVGAVVGGAWVGLSGALVGALVGGVILAVGVAVAGARRGAPRPWGVRALLAVVRSAWLYPAWSVPMVAVVVAVVGPWWLAVLVAGVAVAVVVWRVRQPAVFERRVMLWRLREAIEGTPEALGLGHAWGLVGADHSPLQLLDLQFSQAGRVLVLQPPPGVPRSEVVARAGMMAESLGVPDARAELVGASQVRVHLLDHGRASGPVRADFLGSSVSEEPWWEVDDDDDVAGGGL